MRNRACSQFGCLNRNISGAIRMGTGSKSQYNETFAEALQWLWGDGYLAPGGPEDVAALLSGVEVEGRDVLDIGSGLGVIAVELAQAYGAKSVIGIDVEQHLIDRSFERANASNVADRVSFRLVEPGPLPFDDATFDIVFTKDVIVHVPDKEAFYKDILRILKSGGVLVGSDWLRGGEGHFSETADKWLKLVHLNFQMKNLEQTRAALQAAGFDNVRLNDRNAFHRGEVAKEVALLNDKFQQLVERIGPEPADYRLRSSRMRQQVIDEGFLRPTHFVGYKR